MSRVIIEVKGGVVQQVYTDSSQVGIYLRDYDHLESQGKKDGPAVYIGSADVSKKDMDILMKAGDQYDTEP